MSVQTTSVNTASVQTINSILVANRGEIARRVFATARTMGLRCVAVYVQADTDAPFVGDADEAVLLHSSYLDGEAIIAAALASGAQAIHPGYGFLSENARFANLVNEAGLVWIGPSPDVIATMGDKIQAKQAAVKADIPTLPSSESDDAAAGDRVGYPLLVKAAAGGGGKGMRLVNSAEELADSVSAARREALSGFGDDRVFLERYVAKARHIEIQILGDEHGNVIHLGERECSIQRRHQKIIEESPSPAVDDELRSAMGDAALALAKSINYSSTGTVEFLVDDDTKEFFFLEVNTRLQVEHPVTEAVTGIDLVRQQLIVACGHPLEIDQSQVTMSGHAVEARLYAEDPANGFLPQTGKVSAFEPATTPSLRWDMGIEADSVVGISFDPMLGKIIAHGPTRSEATARLALGLERLHLGGVTTNRDFLAAVLRSSDFLSGATTTDFIERVQDLNTPVEPADIRLAAIAGALWLQGQNASQANVLTQIPSGWRNSRLPMERTVLTCGSHEVEVLYRQQRDGSFAIGEAPSCGAGKAKVHQWTPQGIDLVVDGRRRLVRITQADSNLYVQSTTTTISFAQQPRFTVPGDDGPTGGLAAPMPGSVLDVLVSAGDTVSAGQTVMVIEAMKMEHPITAPRDGQVEKVMVAKGQQVELGLVLLVLADDDTSEADEDNQESS